LNAAYLLVEVGSVILGDDLVHAPSDLSPWENVLW
jgi:hypothetical protein